MNDAFNLLARVTLSGAGVGRNLNPEGRRTFLGPYRERTVRRNAAAMLRDAAEASEYLRRLDLELRATLGDRPVLLVFGSASPTVKEKFPERWKKSFPDAKLVMGRRRSSLSDERCSRPRSRCHPELVDVSRRLPLGASCKGFFRAGGAERTATAHCGLSVPLPTAGQLTSRV